jgi:diadenosine tetraphosphate (Ap4A) HIT family hydrolase
MAPAVGYATVVFRGRHAADLADLTDEELAGYWSDVRVAALALRTVFAPVHLNYSVLGNEVPHLHTHVLPRYALDPAPLRPLPPDVWDTAARLTARNLDEQVGRLKDAVELLR